MTETATPADEKAPGTTPDPTVAAEEKAETKQLSNAQIIARRSADITSDAATDGKHVKVFVLPPGPKPTEANGYDHRANFAATRQYAIGQGLRPTGDVELVSIEGFGPGKKSWACTYAVPVTPAERVDNWAEHVGTTVITDNETDASGTHVPNATTPKATSKKTSAKPKAAASKSSK